MYNFFRAAICTVSLGAFSIASAQDINHFEGVNNSIPSPVFSHRLATSPTSGLNIERIAGCHGDVSAARQNIISSEKRLKEPLFDNEKHTPSTFGLDDLGEAACLTDDDPVGLQAYDPEVMTIESYFYDEFFCGCGTCSTGEFGESFPDTELTERLSDKQKTDYAVYTKKRTEEIEIAKKEHQEYETDYQSWQAKRTKALGPASLRITITPQEDLAEGTLTIYNYSWFQYRWCGSLSDANRENLQTKKVDHPAIKAGESLDIWLENVNLDLFWGVLRHTPESTPEQDFQQLEKTNKEAIKQGDYESPPLYYRALPEALKGRILETQSGRSEMIIDDCCSC